MKPHTPYDPEDIESLMRHKSFSELYPEEREFVLRHVSGAEEYEEMRLFLAELQQGNEPTGWLDPDPSVRHRLMEEMKAYRRGRLVVWLNQFWLSLRPPEVSWYRTPAFRIALTAVVAGTLLMVWLPRDQRKDLAALRPESRTSRPSVLPGAAQAETPADGEQRDSVLPAVPRDISAVEEVVALAAPSMPAGAVASDTPMKYIVHEDLATEEKPVEEVPADSSPLEDESALRTIEGTVHAPAAATVLSQTPAAEATAAEGVSRKAARNGPAQESGEILPPASTPMSRVSGLLDALYTAR